MMRSLHFAKLLLLVVLTTTVTLGCGRGNKTTTPEATDNRAKTGTTQTPSNDGRGVSAPATTTGDAATPGGIAAGPKPAAGGQLAVDPNVSLASIGPPPVAQLLVDTKNLVEKYPDGKMKRERTVSYYAGNSQPQYNGAFREWHPNGQIWKEGQYKEGKREGKWVFYGENGKLNKSGLYKKGHSDGTWEFFHTDGSPSREENWADGQRNGVWKYYDDNGKQIIKQEEYRNNQPNGAWTTWYVGTNQKSSDEQYLDGKRHGVQSSWYPNGKPRIVVEFRNGKQHGKMSVFKENGDKVIEREYRDGEPVN